MILKILLYKYYGFVCVNVINNNNIIIPIIKWDKDQSGEVYGTSCEIASILQFIDISALIGYRPLLSLYHSQLSDISLDIMSSELVYSLNLSKFEYVDVLGIPCVKVCGKQVGIIRSTMSEFTYDDIAPLITTLYQLINNSFYIDINNDKNVDKNKILQIARVYNIKLIYETPTRLYFRSENRDDLNLVGFNITSAMLDINNGNIPRVSIVGDWLWMYKSDLQTLAKLKYAAIRAFYDMYKNNDVMMSQVDKIHVGADMVINAAVNKTDVNIFKSLVRGYLDAEIRIYVAENEKDAMYVKVNQGDGIFVVYNVFGQWVVSSTQIINPCGRKVNSINKNKNDKNNKNDKHSSYGYSDLVDFDVIQMSDGWGRYVKQQQKIMN